MGREEDAKLREAKRGYRCAEAEGHREEEARWANVIGDLLKRRGEYVEALRWLRIDYDLSSKFLPQKQLLPTCQSLGEVYLRLGRHKEALSYQKKHLELAKESDDLIEQQRASTQLGRTYYEIFLKSEDDHHAIRNAKKYFKSAMKFAQNLRESYAHGRSSQFLNEFIDAHNNIGMLELDLDNLDEAKEILLKALQICDEEEVDEYDAARSRLHNNLGSVYLNLRQWGKSREHIEKDILICKMIKHKEGESKGFINMGELHYRVQKYDDATKCYEKALEIAEGMEDEHALVDQIAENIAVIQEAKEVLEDLKREEQKLRRLARITCNAKGTPQEREYLLEQTALLDHLIEKSRIIFHWKKHQEYAKMKKRVAVELCDKEKLGDSYLVVGESYQKLRNFNKARKWYMKSWSTYRSFENLEGQALSKINIGEVLDSSGDWAGALSAFEEGYKLAIEGKLRLVQLSALENMHYSHMIRFDNIEEARKLQYEIQNLKHLIKDENEVKSLGNEKCSESDTDWCDISDGESSECNSLSKDNVDKIEDADIVRCPDESITIASLFKKKKRKSNSKTFEKVSGDFCRREDSSTSNKSSHKESINHKRVRVVFSDDEDNNFDSQNTIKQKVCNNSVEDIIIEDTENGSRGDHANLAQELAEPELVKDVFGICKAVAHEEQSSSLKSRRTVLSQHDARFGFASDMEDANTPLSMASDSKMECQGTSGSPKFCQSSDHNMPNTILNFKWNLIVRVGDHLVCVDPSPCLDGDKLNCELLKVEVACLYYLQLSKDKQLKGLLPVFQSFKFLGKHLGSFEPLEEFHGSFPANDCIEAIIDAWVLKRMMKLYVDCCEKISEKPSLDLLKRLYCLEVSEDEIIISNCGLQDVSISPLIDALHEQKAIALLDISHNLLGNETMERLQKMFALSSQTYGSLTLDFHCNRFGPTSLFLICESPVILARLEVLNLSGNRLTDACSSYLSTILVTCKGLYSLSIEQCSITSRTIQKIADVLDDSHVLSQLNIGKNKPISGSSLTSLITKLSKLKRFSDLSLTEIKLNRNMIESICTLVKNSTLSSLLLASTGLGSDGAVAISEVLSVASQELVKLDISYCGLVPRDFARVCANIGLIGSLCELNLEGNTLGKEVSCLLESLLRSSQCPLRVLILNKCRLGLTAIIRLIQSVEENICLEELHVADNANVTKEETLAYKPEELETIKPSNQIRTCEATSNYTNMEVADSDDELMKDEMVTAVCMNGSCISGVQQSLRPLAACLAVQQLSAAILLAKQLTLLDLSANRFSSEDIKVLYASWSSRAEVSPQRHLTGDYVHFSVEGKRCCGIKACCKMYETI